jgi:GTPase involved in cell partitioning and DNA repair
MDRVRIEVRGGRGGNGCVSHEVLSPGRKRPSGGNGGPGGNVYIVADRGMNGLSFQTFHFNAGNGTNGGSDGLTGRGGEDVTIRVPVGTIVSQRIPESLEYLFDENGDEDDDDEGLELGLELPKVDLDTHGVRRVWRVRRVIFD